MATNLSILVDSPTTKYSDEQMAFSDYSSNLPDLMIPIDTQDAQEPPNPIEQQNIPANYTFTFDEIDKTAPIDKVNLDMDHTIGNISIITIYIKCWRHFNKADGYPPYELFRWFFEGGGWRPHLKEFLLYLVDLRSKGHIRQINIHTSVSNYNGYVDWIAQCMDKFCETEGIIDNIYDSSVSNGFSRCGATYKPISPSAILFDDKPWNAYPYNRSVGVPYYEQNVSNEPFYQMFDKQHHKELESVLEYDARQYPQNYNDFTGDTFFKDIVPKLKEHFGC